MSYCASTSVCAFRVGGGRTFANVCAESCIVLSTLRFGRLQLLQQKCTCCSMQSKYNILLGAGEGWSPEGQSLKSSSLELSRSTPGPRSSVFSKMSNTLVSRSPQDGDSLWRLLFWCHPRGRNRRIPAPPNRWNTLYPTELPTPH